MSSEPSHARPKASPLTSFLWDLGQVTLQSFLIYKGGSPVSHRGWRRNVHTLRCSGNRRSCQPGL